MNQNFWHQKKVLVTGHTGFKGSWLALWLQKMGATVSGYSLAPPTSPSLFEQACVVKGMSSEIGDIRNAENLTSFIDKHQPEIVFHLAAQSLVRESYQDPMNTYSTNVIGSLNLLEAVRKSRSIKAVVMVSTDKCYENIETDNGYKESDRLGGFDPYSSSKACLELLVDSYRKSYFNDESKPVAIATARAGNVIGGGDWAVDRLIPDILTAIKSHQPVVLRYPNAIRPWQHVLEPLSGYLLLAEKLYQQGDVYAQAWNFGPNETSNKQVKWITQYLLDHITTSSTLAIHNVNQPHETSCLKLNCQKANLQLDWYPVWNITETLDQLISWANQDFKSAMHTKNFCLQQIEEYCLKQEAL